MAVSRKQRATNKHKGLEKFFYTGTKKGIKPEQIFLYSRIQVVMLATVHRLSPKARSII